MLLSLEGLPPVHVRYIICYITEGYFFVNPHSDGIMFFLNFRDLPEFYALGGRSIHPGHNFAYGLLGNALPLFRFRDPLLCRILGYSMMNLNQEQWNQSLATDLASRARTAAADYHIGPDAAFQKRAFGAFALKCRQRHAKLIVCCGHNNPILDRAIDPSLHADMLAFLRAQAAKDTNILLLEEAQMPLQTEKDYDDLSHVSTAAQVQFSQYMAGVLENLMQARQSAAHAGL
jgi:hypothetical protein